MGKLFRIQRSQVLPVDLETAWDFISSPQNLKTITPEYMGFDIINPEGNRKMYSGQIIEYTVRPLFNIPLKWVTEITHIEAPWYFVDEQRFGPYKFWHHKHFVEKVDAGVKMTDLVHYSLPLGVLGNITNALLVRKKLEGIFDYRQKVLEDKFGEAKVGSIKA